MKCHSAECNAAETNSTNCSLMNANLLRVIQIIAIMANVVAPFGLREKAISNCESRAQSNNNFYRCN